MPFELADFYNTTRAARKVIVVDLGFLGDSVHLLPALAEIKRHYPGAELHTLSAPVGAEVLRLAAGVDHAWAFPLGPQSPPWWRHWDVIRALRRERFDLAFNFGGADRSIFLTALTGAKWRVAHPGGRNHFWNRWLIPHWTTRQNQEQPVFEQRRGVLAECGLTLAPPRFELTVPAPARQWAETQATAGAIHFSINASTHLKEWPLENWIELARELLRAHPGVRLVATCGPAARERERLRQFAAGINDTRLTLAEAPAIAQLLALLGRCALHAGADSGVLHLAQAVGLPTVAIFRDYAGKAEWLPRGDRHRHLTAPCPCALCREPRPDCAVNAACLRQISPAMVAEKIRELRPAK